jgi:hypothetical protein
MSNYTPNEARNYAEGPRMITSRWTNPPVESGESSWTRVRTKVERTIAQNPGAALAAFLSVGVVIGWLLKRR